MDKYKELTKNIEKYLEPFAGVKTDARTRAEVQILVKRFVQDIAREYSIYNLDAEVVCDSSNNLPEKIKDGWLTVDIKTTNPAFIQAMAAHREMYPDV